MMKTYDKLVIEPIKLVNVEKQDDLYLTKAKKAMGKDNVDYSVEIWKNKKVCYFAKAIESNPILSMYIPIRGKSEPSDTQDFDGTEAIEDFLGGEKKVLLIRGAAGAGKSSFCKNIEKSLWSKFYNIQTSYIPIYIDLAKIDGFESKLNEYFYGKSGLG